MASVWVARQRGKHGFEKLVAIKTILPKFAADPRFQEMFLDEARIASRIEHVNVAQIFDLGEEHDILYLTMEYVDGEALSKLNRACQRSGVKIPTGVVMRVLADTCSGLHEAHELRDAGRPLDIVHRDVSPHNILVSAKGVAKLIDFGIAKARSRVGNDTNSGVLKGKIQYMAPEQALGRPVDRRADVWAIGAIMYHLITGRPAYEGDNQLATLHLLGSGRPPVPLPDSVHPSIRAVVRTALAHAPENRFASAEAMREAIEDAMVEAMVPTTTADVASFANEHLALRTEKRRQSIDLALAAAAERQRVEELLRPAIERHSSGMPVAMPSSGPQLAAAALSSSASLPLPAESRSSIDAPNGTPAPADAIARLTPRLSEPPTPGSASYATIGSASLDASVQPIPKSRRGLLALVAFIVVVAAGATVVSFAVFKPKTQAGPSLPVVAAAAASTAPGSAPASVVTASVAPRAATSASNGRPIPLISATSLPTVAATPSPPRWNPGPVVAPPPPQPAAPLVAPSPSAAAPPAPPPAPPAPAASTAPVKPKKPAVDDGF
jgi:serine/threonine-protein kinase